MFVNDNGFVRTKKVFPKRMTWKRALELSIEKWEFILSELQNNKEVNTDSVYCALCYRAHISNPDGTWCSGNCPVAKQTGKPMCHDTPYYDIRLWAGGYPTGSVQAEIDFLKSL